jgi:hypothetical protein
VFGQTALKIEMLKTSSGSDHLVKSRSGPMGLADQSQLAAPELGRGQKDAA